MIKSVFPRNYTIKQTVIDIIHFLTQNIIVGIIHLTKSNFHNVDFGL